jgi:DNA polymerase III psi subunit
MERLMPASIKLSAGLIKDAKLHAEAMHRSVAKQIEYWARLGKVAEENPDLPINILQDILASIEEVRAGNTNVYQFR